MSYGAYLRELLRPLRIYGLEDTANGGELEAQGKALDGVEAAMEEVQREMLICTAGSCQPGAAAGGAGRPAAHRRGQLYLDGDQR